MENVCKCLGRNFFARKTFLVQLKGNSATRVEYIQFWLVNIACSKNPCVEWLSIGFLANPALKNLTQRAPRYKYNFFINMINFTRYTEGCALLVISKLISTWQPIDISALKLPNSYNIIFLSGTEFCFKATVDSKLPEQFPNRPWIQISIRPSLHNSELWLKI